MNAILFFLIIIIIDNLGILYKNQDKLNLAKEYYLIALEIKKKALCEEHTVIVNKIGLFFK